MAIHDAGSTRTSSRRACVRPHPSGPARLDRRPSGIRSYLTILAALVALALATPAGAHTTNPGHVDQASFSPKAKSTASWFDDHGPVACVAHVLNGYAHLPGPAWPCGARILFCYEHHCVFGYREDSGPYVPGRLFDLNAHLKHALGCPDLCPVTWLRGL